MAMRLFYSCLTLPAEKENQPIRVLGRQHKRYLREQKRVTHNSYFADIDEQAMEIFSRLVKQIVEREEMTEQLETDNPFEWVTFEILNTNLIYI